MKSMYFPDRPATEITFLQNETSGLFSTGEDVVSKLENSTEPYNEFFLMDAAGMTWPMICWQKAVRIIWSSLLI